MRYAFFGTPEFAAIILEKLAKDGMAPAVLICNPDKPMGRKKIVTPPPAKQVALKHGIEVMQPENLRSWIMEHGTKLKGCEFAVVAAYAKIIPQRVLDLFPKGVIGVHPSLLPKYRGASPIQSVILSGESSTGITLYLLDKEVDHGPIIASEALLIDEHDNYSSLLKKLAQLGGELLLKKLPEWYSGKVAAKEQNHKLTTFTAKFTTQDGLVDINKDKPLLIYRKIRALNPEPGVHAFILKDGKNIRVKLLDASYSAERLQITEIQVEGRRPTTDIGYIKSLFG